MRQPEVRLKPKLEIVKPDKELLMPGELGATVELTVSDSRTGKVTEHRGPMRSESFVRQFLELLWMQMYPIGMLTEYQLRDTGNNLRQIATTSYMFAANAGIGVITFGIVGGTGNTPPTVNDYALQTPILHDSSPPTAGRMQYGAVTYGAPSSDTTTSQFTITRNLANASGGSVTVNEIGVYVEASVYSTIYYFLTIRDVIGGGIAVPNGQTLTINYRPQAVV